MVILAADPSAEKKDPPKKVEAATPRAKKSDLPDPRKVKLEDAAPAADNKPADPFVTEMKVESGSQGASRTTGEKQKAVEVHGETIVGGGATARGAAGNVSVQDKKKGKWAVSAEAGKATQNRNR